MSQRQQLPLSTSLRQALGSVFTILEPSKKPLSLLPCITLSSLPLSLSTAASSIISVTGEVSSLPEGRPEFHSHLAITF